MTPTSRREVRYRASGLVQWRIAAVDRTSASGRLPLSRILSRTSGTGGKRPTFKRASTRYDKHAENITQLSNSSKSASGYAFMTLQPSAGVLLARIVLLGRRHDCCVENEPKRDVIG